MNLPSRSLLAFSLALGAAAASFTFAPEALAADTCKADADCGAGFFCEIMPPPVAGCASKDGTPCEPPTTTTETQGYCREKAINCTTDADCPAYLGCVAPAAPDVACTAPACPPGTECPEPVCDQPPPAKDEPKLCAPKIIECASDAECPANFACNIETGSACAAIDCAPGSECPEPVCQPGKKICGPKEIACEADSACPTDWRCITFKQGGCSASGGSTGTGGTETPPAPAPGSNTQDTGPDCKVTTRSLCAPRGYLAGIEQGGVPLSDAKGSTVAESADNGSSKGAPSYSPPTKGSATQGSAGSTGSSDDGGCSVGHGRSGGAGMLSALLLGLVARLARRKRLAGFWPERGRERERPFQGRGRLVVRRSHGRHPGRPPQFYLRNRRHPGDAGSAGRLC